MFSCFVYLCSSFIFFFFFFNDTATTEIYTLSLHDALPIWWRAGGEAARFREVVRVGAQRRPDRDRHPEGRSGSRRKDRKSTRLNSSHLVISYAVFCLKKKRIESSHGI